MTGWKIDIKPASAPAEEPVEEPEDIVLEDEDAETVADAEEIREESAEE